MTTLYFPRPNNKHAGIKIEYIKSRKLLNISGWYDSIVGIQPDSITLKEFLTQLGISKKDCIKAFEDMPKGRIEL